MVIEYIDQCTMTPDQRERPRVVRMGHGASANTDVALAPTMAALAPGEAIPQTRLQLCQRKWARLDPRIHVPPAFRPTIRVTLQGYGRLRRIRDRPHGLVLTHAGL
jgi:hypothetical protein